MRLILAVDETHENEMLQVRLFARIQIVPIKNATIPPASAEEMDRMVGCKTSQPKGYGRLRVRITAMPRPIKSTPPTHTMTTWTREKASARERTNFKPRPPTSAKPMQESHVLASPQ